MPHYEVDYWNKQEQVRTRVVFAEKEMLLPFVLRKLDRRFIKIKSVKLLNSKENRDEKDKAAVDKR